MEGRSCKVYRLHAKYFMLGVVAPSQIFNLSWFIGFELCRVLHRPYGISALVNHKGKLKFSR
ncbi:uncharacterized protein J3R85_008917 [Psidium guajava]|nr:uncharacterized protein J3R85_008917 [Psidium guajava]